MECLMPLALLMAGLWLTTRLLFPSRVLDIAAGVLLRDVVLTLLKCMWYLFALPFRLAYFLSTGAHKTPVRSPGRRRRYNPRGR